MAAVTSCENTLYPGETGNNGYENFWGVNKVRYGLGESSELY